MHWIYSLTEEERISIYQRYERLCKRVTLLMIFSFFMILVSSYFVFTQHDYILFIISFIIHGILGSILIVYGNTIHAVKYLEMNDRNKYRVIGLYFGLYLIPLLLSNVVKEIASIN